MEIGGAKDKINKLNKLKLLRSQSLHFDGQASVKGRHTSVNQSCKCVGLNKHCQRNDITIVTSQYKFILVTNHSHILTISISINKQIA